MKAATVKELKTELSTRSEKELVEICLHLSKFKKENKELLSYLLYDADNESGYIKDIKNEVDIQFDEINTSSYFFIKKSIRKILRNIKKYIRYSKNKETEVELLMFFCHKLKNFTPTYTNNVVLTNTYNRQLEMIEKAISTLDEDLQYDYGVELEKVIS